METTANSQPLRRRKAHRSGRIAPLALLLLFITGLHYLLWKLLMSGAADSGGFSTLLGGYLALSSFAVLAGFLSMRVRNTRWNTFLSWTGMLALGMFSSLFVLAIGRAILLALLSWIGVPVLPWGAVGAEAVLAVAFWATALGFVVARMPPAIVRVDVPIAGLPAALHGFRIAQITDIHVGPTIGRRLLQRIVDQVNALQADLVAITGDVVDGDVNTLRDKVAPLQQLQGREGVALVLGNHELYSGALPWVNEFRRLGMRVLLNEHFLVERGAARLAVAGVTDHTTAHFMPELACDPRQAIQGALADVRVLLAHQPVTAGKAAEAGFHLSLHGHTHGGQWWPWNYFVRLQQPVVKGLHRFGRMWSYTSVGTGYWGPPKRHFRSEITLLTLIPASSG